jgi:hypothetical protein
MRQRSTEIKYHPAIVIIVAVTELQIRKTIPGCGEYLVETCGIRLGIAAPRRIDGRVCVGDAGERGKARQWEQVSARSLSGS